MGASAQHDADFGGFCRFIVEHCHFDTNNHSDHSGVDHARGRTTVHSHRSAPIYAATPDAAGNPPCEFGGPVSVRCVR
jgi:hypothetical protein